MREVYSVAVVSEQGSNFYRIGTKIKGGIIHKIEDHSFEESDSPHVQVIIACIDENGKVLVSLYGVPVVIEYL